MKYFLLMVLTLFSFSSFAVSEKELNPEQKAVLYQIHDVIEKEYPISEKKIDPMTFDDSYAKAVKELEIIISSVKSFGEMIKVPVQNFLETDLAKYIGVIVVLNFFGENISSFSSGVIFMCIAFYGLRNTTIVAYTNYGRYIEEKGFCKKHGKFVYDKRCYEEDKAYPLVRLFTTLILIIVGYLIIF